MPSMRDLLRRHDSQQGAEDTFLRVTKRSNTARTSITRIESEAIDQYNSECD